MKTVNLGEKYTHRITLRLNDEQYAFLMDVAHLLGVSPSDYLRMCVNSGMVASKQGFQVGCKTLVEGVAGTHEDVKADSNNKL